METNKIVSLIGDARVKINGFLVLELRRRGIDGLAPSHGGILHHLFNNEAAAMKDLAKAVRRDKSTVTTLVGKLIKVGYVEKVPCSDDQRSYLVRLTRQGEALRPAFEEVSKVLLARVWQGIDPAEQEDVIRILKKVAANF